MRGSEEEVERKWRGRRSSMHTGHQNTSIRLERVDPLPFSYGSEVIPEPELHTLNGAARCHPLLP